MTNKSAQEFRDDLTVIKIGEKNGAPPVPAAERLKATRLALPGFGWTTHEATIPPDAPMERIMDGAFWRFVAPKLRRGDHIKWRDDTLIRFGELVVVASDIATGRLELRELWSLNVAAATTAETERGGYSIKDLGVHEGFGIYRDADGKQMRKNIPSHDEAARMIRVEFIPNAGVEAVHAAKAGL